MNCILCQISKGRAPASFVYSDDHVFGILSLDQPNPYKVLVVPHEHCESIYELTEIQGAAIMPAVVKIARAIRRVSSCEGLNLVQSNGNIAGQEVFHFHLHIVPRRRDDNIVLEWPFTTAERAVLDEMAAQIKRSVDILKHE
jgi:histidine triad (HIT) family protein